MNISHYISHKLCNYMVKNNIIDSEKIEFYLYCYDFVFDLIIFNASILIIGCILHVPVLALLYIITITPTKMMAGGAHASSRETCSFISYFTAIMALLVIKIPVIYIPNQFLFIAFTCSIISIVILTPIDTPNRRLDVSKKSILKKYCIMYCLFLFILFILLYFLYFKQGVFLMTICVIIIAINQYIGIITNKLSGDKAC